MDLSIVITTRNRKDNLIDCVNSVSKSDLSNIKCELLIVDDNSSDGTEKITESDVTFKPTRIIHNDVQKMMVQSRNIGAKMSFGSYVLFIDDDNEIDTKMIKNLISSFDINVGFGVLGSSNYYFDTKKKYMDYQKINLFTGRTRGIISKKNEEVYDSDGAPNVFIIKKEVFDKCGYFDETLIQTFTEPDFAKKAEHYGFKCGVVPNSITYHKVKRTDSLKPRSLGGEFDQKAYCLMRNRSVYVSRYGSFLNKTVYFLVFSWMWPLVYSIFALKGKRPDLVRLYWKGFMDGVTFGMTGRLNNSISKK
jgi:GT2 family glycosyltransferase